MRCSRCILEPTAHAERSRMWSLLRVPAFPCLVSLFVVGCSLARLSLFPLRQSLKLIGAAPASEADGGGLVGPKGLSKLLKLELTGAVRRGFADRRSEYYFANHGVFMLQSKRDRGLVVARCWKASPGLLRF